MSFSPNPTLHDTTISGGRVRDIIAERFPAVFAQRRKDKRPLSLSIVDELTKAMPDIHPALILAAVHDYTSGPTYLRHIVLGAKRIDLTGAEAGECSAHDQEHAMRRLDMMRSERGLRKRLAANNTLAKEVARMVMDLVPEERREDLKRLIDSCSSPRQREPGALR